MDKPVINPAIIDELSGISHQILKALNQEITINPLCPYQHLFAICQLANAMSHIGWVEHTSDWDIGATITTHAGGTISIGQGYGDTPEMWHNGKVTDDYFTLEQSDQITLHFYLEDEDGNETPLDIPILNIKTIKFWD